MINLKVSTGTVQEKHCQNINAHLLILQAVHEIDQIQIPMDMVSAHNTDIPWSESVTEVTQLEYKSVLFVFGGVVQHLNKKSFVEKDLQDQKKEEVEKGLLDIVSIAAEHILLLCTLQRNPLPVVFDLCCHFKKTYAPHRRSKKRKKRWRRWSQWKASDAGRMGKEMRKYPGYQKVSRW